VAESGPALDQAARQAEWQWLDETKKAIDGKRGELAALESQAATGAAVGPQISVVNQEIAKLGDELGRRLVDYINADPPTPGQPMKPEQLAAVRLKSAEDILIAKEHITLGGDYKKAIDIYATALLLDTENAELKAALSDAQAKRFMTTERFAAVKKGMSQAEVTGLLGRPLARNVRDYPEKRVSAWYYTKNDAGEAAGIFFNDKKLVYSVDFNAVKKAEEKAPE
jgi:outer membrane protein assembly factor BamE (lipoprotein component of BamABCDE complex)